MLLSLAEIRRLSANMVELDGELVFRCRCGEVVPERLELCHDCAVVDAESMREIVLGKALRSLPAMPHAVLGPSLRWSVDHRLLAGINQPTPWSASSGEGLTLLGSTGAGKTTLVVALARHRLSIAKSAAEVKIAAGIRFVSAPELQLERDRLPLSATDDGPLMRSALKATLLILDEIGFEHEPRAGVAPVVSTLMQARYNAGLTTLPTSGLTEAGLAARYGDATKRRLCERNRVITAFGPVQFGLAGVAS